MKKELLVAPFFIVFFLSGELVYSEYCDSTKTPLSVPVQYCDQQL